MIRGELFHGHQKVVVYSVGSICIFLFLDSRRRLYSESAIYSLVKYLPIFFGHIQEKNGQLI